MQVKRTTFSTKMGGTHIKYFLPNNRDRREIKDFLSDKLGVKTCELSK